ncbi:MAG: HIT domain-containing protein [Candidatus Omnitrophota bacterium]|nr:HIT domain-containing protein [Candidatus Omnitrophota bacterium]
MNQKRLWAPWRINYIQKKTSGCLFCKIAKSINDGKNFIIHRGEFSFSTLNIYPYNNGHIMFAPYRHVNDLRKLSEAEFLDLLGNINQMQSVLDKLIKPQGYNIGVNIGRAAGAGYPYHIHIHLVPRWVGDTNFMPITAKTKVISESLSELYRKIKDVY